MGKKYNDGLSKWQRYRLRLKEKGIINGHNKSDKEKKKDYRKTERGRALTLISGYKTSDKKHNRGECTLTAEWIIEHIFSQPCHYCGKTDWHEVGCDRIDNSLPHTPENVVPCCHDCNNKKARYEYDEFIEKIKSGGSPTS
jgi:hypothetical protein